MPMSPLDHAERRVLADEIHARPPEVVVTPAQASYVAVLIDSDARGAELTHLAALARTLRVAEPRPGDTHWRADAAGLRVKWERHGEFSGYLVIDERPASGAEGAATAATAMPAAGKLPAAWWHAVPGRSLAAVHVEFTRTPPSLDAAAALEAQRQRFDGHTVVAARIAEGAATVITDFRIGADGFTRMQVLDHGLTPDQAGRTLQRLVEIEAYRMLALLALPVARRQAPRIQQIEAALASLTDGLSAGGGDDEQLLHQITRLSAEVESGLAASQFRFGACRAYYELVMRRITELREVRLPGLQTIEEFMARRFTPAVATCQTVSQRLQSLSERVARASGLLSTRVDIARERQNQLLLGSMDRRARQQLRLQQTVEGLSVAAIVYYTSGLIGSLAKAGRAAGLPLNADVAVGVSIPVLAAAAFFMLRRARRHALRDDGV